MFTTSPESLAYIIIHSVDYLLELLAVILLFAFRKKQPDRSRSFLGWFFLLSLVLSALGVLDVAVNGDARRTQFLEPLYVLGGFPIFLFVLLYLAECLRPFYINLQRLVLLLLPWAVLAVLTYIICLSGYTELYTWQDLFNNISHPDVWIRFLSLLVYLPYGVWVYRMPNNWRKSTASRDYVRILCIITMLLTITYVGGHGLQIMVLDLTHVVLYVVLELMTLFYEFHERPTLTPDKAREISLAAERTTADISVSVQVEVPTQPAAAPANTAATDSHSTVSPAIREVMNRLENVMQNQDVWQNPDLTMDDLVEQVATNENYLLRAIKHMGYKNYSDMLNHRRVAYMVERMKAEPDEPLQNIFYDAGYRSRTTAWRNFTAIVGKSPAEHREETVNN